LTASSGDDRRPGGPPRLPAGRVGRPHGLDGSFYVTRPRARLLSLGTEVGLEEERRKIVRRAGTDERPIVRLEGVGDRTGAEALRGRELTVEQGDAPALGEGEWWAHELEGCEVHDGGRLLGTVRRLLELPSCEALEVERAGGGSPLLVPMVSAAIRGVDPAGRRIEVDAEFLDLEDPGPAPGTETPRPPPPGP
jgi:16S rRNA processing protein RimM